jgi:alkyl sulfatase BDS1-like metallo-beta-lactamase superfamily hydrolase
MRTLALATTLATTAALLAVSGAVGPAALAEPASAPTRAANAGVLAQIAADEREDEDFATRGFIATWPETQIKTADGRVAWDFSAYASVQGPPPETVNPSLWRHAGLLAKHGLFKVSDRVYQVRGFDVSNMTIVVGDTGLIVIDPLTTAEPARAALTLARRTLGDKPVKAVIYTHSHADHFGGVRGVVEQADVDAGRAQIIAPAGFMEHAVSENVIAGNAMSRRGSYQFGTGLPTGPEGSMTSGVGMGISAGTLTLIAPTKSIERTGETLTIDGLTIEFQLTPNTEAPSEMHFFFPQLATLVIAENAGSTFHNVLTPRGALVRDSKAWSDYLTESLRLYGGRTDTLVTSHGWPRFGRARVADFVASQRDLYKYLHDQSVRLMNQGYTGPEIAERIQLPDAIARRWFNRGYYGTLRHNSRAVYQRYMGWYDANPAHLNALPPEEAGRKYVAAMGGARKVLAEGRRAIAAGDYRWAAEVLDRLVFAEPGNGEAKELLAQAHTQMAYQAESAIWRNMYLSAARELRQGVTARPAATASLDLLRNTPTAMVLDLLAVRLNPEKAGAQALRLALVFPERNERHLVTVRNSVLVHETNVTDAVDATVTMPRALFLQALLTGAPPAREAMRIEGDATVLVRFMGLFDAPDANFAIVTP